jgi:hypothetical protein
MKWMVVAAWVFSLIAILRWLDIDARDIRDLQRRIAELEQRIK